MPVFHDGNDPYSHVEWISFNGWAGANAFLTKFMEQRQARRPPRRELELHALDFRREPCGPGQGRRGVRRRGACGNARLRETARISCADAIKSNAQRSRFRECSRTYVATNPSLSNERPDPSPIGDTGPLFRTHDCLDSPLAIQSRAKPPKGGDAKSPV